MKVVHFHRNPSDKNYSIERLFSDIRSSLPKDVDVTVCESRYRSKGLFRRLSDSIRAVFNQGDINHITGDIHFIAIFLPSKKTVLTIHDCRSLDRLGGVRYWVYWFFWFWLPIRRSGQITVISESTKRHLERHISLLNKNVSVVSNCVSKEFCSIDRPFDCSKPRILQVGTGSNKNLVRVSAALKTIPCILAIIGPLSLKQVSQLEGDNIEFENFTDLSDDEIVQQYVQSDIVIFASTYEGFGLPILEAQAVGRPLITSGTSPMQDVAGDGAVLVNPYDVESIRGGVASLVESRELRKRVVASGLSNAELYRSDLIAEKYCEIYRSMLKEEP